MIFSIWRLAALAAFSSSFLACSRPATPAPEARAPVVPVEIAFPYVISPRSTLYEALVAQGVDARAIHAVVTAAKPVFDLGRLRAGTRFALTREGAELTGMDFRLSPVERFELRRVAGAWSGQLTRREVTSRVVTFGGVVATTLWESAESANMDPNLISQLAEIFAWQVDFAREVRVNDRWRLSVERQYVGEEPIGWGAILAAEYENGGRVFNGVRFEPADGQTGYYAADGSSLKRMFLKSPIAYARISSRFARKRFHPVLKFNRPHLGVDYAAARGTPIHAVGDGVVIHAGRLGGGGNTVKIRHNSVYQTAYLHMSGFAKGIRSGARVTQGQVIGYVGATGLATGPHLHFEFKENGRVLDPLSQKFPSADPVPAERMTEFRARAAELMSRLPGWQDVLVAKAAASASRALIPQAHGRTLQE